MLLAHYQRCGHKPVALVGGATGMIGDPSGKSSERNLLDEKTLRHNQEAIKRQLAHFLDFESNEANAAVLVNNYDWMKNFSFLEFIRDVGKHITVNYMMAKDSVKNRISSDASEGMSFTEFTYQLVQGYDFLHLYKERGCTIQMGGSDQWGNITSGMDLIRRMQGKQAYAITYPLITTSDGIKLGKSMGNAVWLDPQKTSPYSFYQFWRNCADDDVIRYLKIFTFFDAGEIAQFEAAHRQDPGARTAHIALAREVTRLVHSDRGVEAAERISEALFRNTLSQLEESDLRQLALDGLPTTEIFDKSVDLVDVLVTSGLAITPRGEVTQGQARKLIGSNAVAVNGDKVSDPEFELTRDAALFGRYHVIQKGKKNHHLVVMV
jgi:tyrosyl-tRNA synthetase